ncbi:MAG: mannonate dehydratase [Cyclobacteriaceae bacterium]|nr:MAG: mannonate dehydratase [Cyclobacteriaceae bacterium]
MKKLKQTWRWFGPDDTVTLEHIKQTGAAGIVTSLHHIPTGSVWTVEEIQKRKQEIENAGLRWSVVESIPVHEDIKLQNPGYKRYINAWQETVLNLAKCGITTVCYNFMPVLDWTRTDLDYEDQDGSRALRFDIVQLAAFDVFLLKRHRAEESYQADQVKAAEKFLQQATGTEIEKLKRNILAGLPGSTETYNLETFRESLDAYKDIDEKKYRKHLREFIACVAPAAEEAGVRLAIHPDDPPFTILGLPRVVSTEADLNHVVDVYDSPFNGICLCTGSLGAREDNDLQLITKRLARRINFVHLRNVKKYDSHSFFEAHHLEGDVNMPLVIKELILENQLRTEPIPFRPDHGHQMLDDLNKKTNPGYSAIGRLRGLAELRGVELGISSIMNIQAS